MAATHSASRAAMSTGVQIQCCLAAPSRRPRPQGQCRARPALRTFGQGRAGGLAAAPFTRALIGRWRGGRASAGRTQSSVRSRDCTWVWAALLLYRGIRAKEVPHRFERGGHLSDEGAGELHLTQVDRNLGIRLGQRLKSAAEQGCRLRETQRTYHERNGAIAGGSPLPDELGEVRRALIGNGREGRARPSNRQGASARRTLR